MDMPFNITREEVLELAAKKLVNAYADESDLAERAEQGVRDRVKEICSDKLVAKVDAFLTSEMEKILSQEICPVDIYGERTGKPTTLRAVLAQRAQEFWNVSVDENGRENHYGGTPRHKVLFDQIVREQFAKAIKENVTVITQAFKEAVKADAIKLVNEHIERLISSR